MPKVAVVGPKDGFAGAGFSAAVEVEAKKDPSVCCCSGAGAFVGKGEGCTKPVKGEA